MHIHISTVHIDTRTPGYEEEMKSKPELTKTISESGQVFEAPQVARDILTGSTRGYFNISTGLDGWLLRNLQPGMSPISNSLEVLQQILCCPIRIIAVVYVAYWNYVCRKHTSGLMNTEKAVSS